MEPLTVATDIDHKKQEMIYTGQANTNVMIESREFNILSYWCWIKIFDCEMYIRKSDLSHAHPIFHSKQIWNELMSAAHAILSQILRRLFLDFNLWTRTIASALLCTIHALKSEHKTIRIIASLLLNSYWKLIENKLMTCTSDTLNSADLKRTKRYFKMSTQQIPFEVKV